MHASRSTLRWFNVLIVASLLLNLAPLPVQAAVPASQAAPPSLPGAEPAAIRDSTLAVLPAW